MSGQPTAAPKTVREVQRLTTSIVSERGDPARSRPILLELIEANPAVDLTEQFAPAMADENTFTAILATYDDMLEDPKTEDKNKVYIRFNILRTLTARGNYLTTPTRRTLMSRATSLAEDLATNNKADGAVWEALGDLYALKDDTQSAVAAYRRSGAAAGGSMAKAQYRIGLLYQRDPKFRASTPAAYEAGIRADAASGSGGKEMKHLLYLGLTYYYLTHGEVTNAVKSFVLAGQAKPDEESPYTFRLEMAEAMLKRGYAREVRDFAEGALKVSPDDEGAKRLKTRAEAAIR